MEGDGSLCSLNRGDRSGEEGARWRELTKEGGWEELASREILWAYGNSYWKATSMGGTGEKAATKRVPRAAARERSEADQRRLEEARSTLFTLRRTLTTSVAQNESIMGWNDSRWMTWSRLTHFRTTVHATVPK